MPDDLDRELAALGAKTERLRPRPGFEDRVLAAIPAAAPAWDASVLRFGKAMLFVAALSAVTAVALGVRSSSDETELSATTYGMEELDW